MSSARKSSPNVFDRLDVIVFMLALAAIIVTFALFPLKKANATGTTAANANTTINATVAMHSVVNDQQANAASPNSTNVGNAIGIDQQNPLNVAIAGQSFVIINPNAHADEAMTEAAMPLKKPNLGHHKQDTRRPKRNRSFRPGAVV